MARPTRESLVDDDPDLVFADGFDAAILGVVERGDEEPFVVYDAKKCIRILMHEEGMGRDEAEEHLRDNIASEWEGARTPGFLWPHDEDGDDE
jgi:hypothetical protein